MANVQPVKSPQKATMVEWKTSTSKQSQVSSEVDVELGILEKRETAYLERKPLPSTPAPAKLSIAPFEQLRRSVSRDSYFKIDEPRCDMR